MDAFVAKAVAILHKYQAPITWALMLAFGLQLAHVYTLPHVVEVGIVFALGWFGVARPSETAGKIAGEVMALRGGKSIAAIVAAIAALMSTEIVEDPNPVEAHDVKGDAIDIVHPADPVIDVEVVREETSGP